MIDFSSMAFERMQALGLHGAMAQAVRHFLASFTPDPGEAGPPDQPLQLARVCAVHRDRLQVHNGSQEFSALVLAKQLKAWALQGTHIAVGDWVLLQGEGSRDSVCTVQALVPGLNRIVRRDADGSRHTVVSNVDTALLVMGLDDDFNLRRLERYLALVQGQGIWPVVVLTKVDQFGATAWARAEHLSDVTRQLRERLPADVLVHALDARDPDIAQDLAPYLGAGQTLVLLGSSGAGKSTLTNTLLGRVQQDTGPVRADDSRGRHTTTARTLVQLPGGACVIDTPGVRSLRPDADVQSLQASFTDIQSLSGQCRFRNCQHQQEPGCAVLAQLSGDRVRNFHKLKREIERDQQTPLDRQRRLAQWKEVVRTSNERMKLKRGG